MMTIVAVTAWLAIALAVCWIAGRTERVAKANARRRKASSRPPVRIEPPSLTWATSTRKNHPWRDHASTCKCNVCR